MKEKGATKKKIIIGIVITVIVAGAICGMLLFHITKKGGLIEAAKTLTKDLEQSALVYGVEMDVNQLLELYQKGDYDADYNITINTPAFFKQINLNGTGSHSQTQKRMKMDCALAMDSSKIADVNLYADEEKLYLCMPELLEGSLVLPTKNYGKEYQNSVLGSMQGNKVDENTSLDLFVAPNELGDMGINLVDSFQKELISFLMQTEVEYTSEQEDNYYAVTIPQSLVASFMKKNMKLEGDLEGYIPKEDLRLKVHVAQYGDDLVEHIRYIENTEEGCKLNNGLNLSFSFGFFGEMKQLEELQYQLQQLHTMVNLGEYSFTMDYEYETNYYNIATQFMQDNLQMSIEFAGKISQEQEKYLCSFDKFQIFQGTESMLLASGTAKLSDLSEQVSIPNTAPEYELLKMTESDYAKLLSKVGFKLFSKLLFV